MTARGVIPFVQDPDFVLWQGDVLDVLAQLPDESVDCCVTSPPYWGLRDYGTGRWDGGDPDCDHQGTVRAPSNGAHQGEVPERADGHRVAFRSGRYVHQGQGASTTCGRCGATRVDQQIGLEATPAEFVARMVDVFRQVRRVLAPHGTVWCNLGDSYVAGQGGRQSAVGEMPAAPTQRTNEPRDREDVDTGAWGSRDVTSKMTPARGTTTLKPKDLVGIPWRVALALQDDGWYLRSDIIWSKPNPLPESVTDRPTKAHEYVFLLTKQPRYWFDQEAVREPFQPSSIERERYGYNHAYANQFRGSPTDKRHPEGKQLPPTLGGLPPEAERGPDGRRQTRVQGGDGSIQHRDGERWPNGGRNIRTVWEIATQPYAEAHFATFPLELPRRAIKAGCPEWVCRTCGKPRERIVERGGIVRTSDTHVAPYTWQRKDARRRDDLDATDAATARAMAGHIPGHHRAVVSESWSDCGHNNYRPGVVLDPFMGSGTTALVAREQGRHSIGIELNPDYCELAAKRLSQLSLLAAEVAS